MEIICNWYVSLFNTLCNFFHATFSSFTSLFNVKDNVFLFSFSTLIFFHEADIKQFSADIFNVDCIIVNIFFEWSKNWIITYQGRNTFFVSACCDIFSGSNVRGFSGHFVDFQSPLVCNNFRIINFNGSRTVSTTKETKVLIS